MNEIAVGYKLITDLFVIKAALFELVQLSVITFIYPLKITLINLSQLGGITTRVWDLALSLGWVPTVTSWVQNSVSNPLGHALGTS